VHLFPAWEVQLATGHVSEEVTCERLRVERSDVMELDELLSWLVSRLACVRGHRGRGVRL
jgi:hypothetical protein